MASGGLAAVWQGLSTQAHYVFTQQLNDPWSPEFAMLVWPHVAYWCLAIYFDVLDRLQLPFTEKHKVVRRERGRENQPTFVDVVVRVLMQQAVQALFNLCLYIFDPNTCARCRDASPLRRCVLFVLGMYVMDSWQYWIHRSAHTSLWLYKHMHSVHHRLLIPYASGALYNSLLEGLLLDTLGGAVTLWVTGMDCRTAAYLFTFGTMKTVFDHSGYRFPINPIHPFFPNSAAFHDVHHDIRFIKTNYSQPFFTHWDYLLGTFKDPASVHLSQPEVDAKYAKEHPKGGKAIKAKVH